MPPRPQGVAGWGQQPPAPPPVVIQLGCKQMSGSRFFWGGGLFPADTKGKEQTGGATSLLGGLGPPFLSGAQIRRRWVFLWGGVTWGSPPAAPATLSASGRPRAAGGGAERKGGSIGGKVDPQVSPQNPPRTPKCPLQDPKTPPETPKCPPRTPKCPPLQSPTPPGPQNPTQGPPTAPPGPHPPRGPPLKLSPTPPPHSQK